MKPEGASEFVPASSAPSVGSGLSYAGSGGKDSHEVRNVDEYAAEASRYGMGMSSAVSASGSENHDVDPVGTSSSVGLYAAALGTAGRPRSDSPLGRVLFIGENE